MKKVNVVTLIVAAIIVVMSAETASAQCCYAWRPFAGLRAMFNNYGGCNYNACAPCASVTNRAPGPCGEYIPRPCDACRQTTESVCNTCQQVVSNPLEPCAPVEPCDVCAPCTTCEQCECDTCDCETTAQSYSDCKACAAGTCPLQKAVARTFEALALARVNATRARYGRRPLRLNKNLESGAYYQSQRCASIGGLQHAGGVAEILAQSNSFDGAIGQWLRSAPHCALMLNPNFTEAGAAYYADQYGRVWCAVQFR